jgi:hypothetical protein
VEFIEGNESVTKILARFEPKAPVKEHIKVFEGFHYISVPQFLRLYEQAIPIQKEAAQKNLKPEDRYVKMIQISDKRLPLLKDNKATSRGLFKLVQANSLIKKHEEENLSFLAKAGLKLPEINVGHTASFEASHQKSTSIDAKQLRKPHNMSKSMTKNLIKSHMESSLLSLHSHGGVILV